MPGYRSKEFSPELAALIERQPSTDREDLTEPYGDLPGPESLIASTANPNDKEGCSQKTSKKFPLSPETISRCLASISENCIEPQELPSPRSLFISPSTSYAASCSATPGPFTSASASPDSIRPCGVDSPHFDSATPSSDSTVPLDGLNGNSLDDHPLTFYHYEKPADPDLFPDTILHWYGQNCKSLQENAEESLQHDKALLEEYIRSNSKLIAQLTFMKNQRKKKQPDSNLVENYRFIVSLYAMLKKMEFKPPPHRHVSSKAILTCLDVTASWLSRARQVVKLLKKIGPDGSSPDPLVTKRLQSNVVTHKGSDLLTFLKHQVRAKNVHTHSP